MSGWDVQQIGRHTRLLFVSRRRLPSSLRALAPIFSLYAAQHILLALLTYVSFLFTLANFSAERIQGKELIHVWDRWDTGQFTGVATRGYAGPWQTAFFPLYPTLERLMRPIDPFIAGLIISNVAYLGVLIVFYRLIRLDFNEELAGKSVLALAVFPTAFFFCAAYNESLFLLLVLSFFYCIRTGNFAIAAILGYLAALTRSAGLILVIPYVYECWQQRRSPLSSLCIPAGTAFFALCCYIQFKDPLSFSHAQAVWGRHLSLPWMGVWNAAQFVLQGPKISFDAIHNMIDISTTLFMLPCVIYCFIRLPKQLWAYSLYVAALYLFLLLFPGTAPEPLQSFSRFDLELFPVFIMIATFDMQYYLLLALPLYGFFTLQFLTGHWTV